MIDLHPLAWACVFLVLLIALFELVRIGKMSGTITVSSGISVIGVLEYLDTLDLAVILGPKSIGLIMLVVGLFKGYARWRTGDVVRKAPPLIGTGDGRSLGTGNGNV